MRIICFGDSLTSCGGENGRYSDILQDRFPGHEFINAGIGGETFVDARVRLQADVLAQAPDVVVIAFGANDWWQDERPVAQWGDDLDYLVREIKAIGAQIVVLGVFGDYFDENDRVAPKNYGSDTRSIEFQALEAAVAAKHECGYVANMQERIVGRRRCWTTRKARAIRVDRRALARRACICGCGAAVAVASMSSMGESPPASTSGL